MNVDIPLFLKLNHAFSGDAATAFFTSVTHLGNGLVLALLILPTLFLFRRDHFKAHALPLVLSVALSGGVVNLIKPIVDRPRPGPYFDTIGQPETVHIPAGTPSDKAFPSGHTQTAFGAAVYLSLMYPVLSPVFLLMASLVGLSRIAIGVHYPLDVAVGALFGAVFSIAGYRAARRRENRVTSSRNLG